MKISRLNIEGFRSLRDVSWSPGDLNVVIGANGTGKSNLLQLLELISISAQGKLGKYIQSLGGMDPIVWDGVSESIRFVLELKPEGKFEPDCYELKMLRLGTSSSYKIDHEVLSNSYKVKKNLEERPFKFLERFTNKALIFDEEENSFTTPEEFVSEEESLLSIASGPFINNHNIPPFHRELTSIAVYHDLHTNKNAYVRQPAVARLENQVDSDGQNLISVMHTLYTGDRDFKKDINSAMKVAFGDDFEELVFPPAADQRIQMRVRWKSLHREQSASELSDGTLRFLFLLTVLASPSAPSVIAIDEPETGLHPSMLPIVAEYATEASRKSQIIFTTHSPQFLDAFTGDRPTTTVAMWENGETTFKTLEDKNFEFWLNEYSLGGCLSPGSWSKWHEVHSFC